MAQNDNSILEAALLGYRAEAQRIELAMADIRKRLGHAKAGTITTSRIPVGQRKKHRISAEGRRRIAEAQRKRWAAQKKHGG